jgi:hypothetical protein
VPVLPMQSDCGRTARVGGGKKHMQWKIEFGFWVAMGIATTLVALALIGPGGSPEKKLRAIPAGPPLPSVFVPIPDHLMQAEHEHQPRPGERRPRSDEN